MKAVRLHRFGGPEVLTVEDLATPGAAGDLSADTVLIRLAASGVNFIDIYQRSGLYKIELPATLGLEGAGTIVECGSAVLDLAPGARIAFASCPGAYAEYIIAPAQSLVPIPDDLSFEDAAAAMLQGMTAHYLACSTFPLQNGQRCLVHAGAGGVGLLLIQIAKLRGATVYTTVSTEQKARLARAAGADAVILYERDDFLAEVKRLTDNAGVDVVCDSVGRNTFERSLQSLRPRGMLVSFGQSSGPVENFNPRVLNQYGSLFLTRPSLGHYTRTREELLARAGEVLSWIRSGQLKLRIGARFPLIDAAKAHVALEGRETSGKVLLI